MSEKTSTTAGEHQNWGDGASGRRGERAAGHGRRCQLRAGPNAAGEAKEERTEGGGGGEPPTNCNRLSGFR